jgi:hypothetical protein
MGSGSAGWGGWGSAAGAWAKCPMAALTVFFMSMKAAKSDSFFALSRSLRAMAYATAAPAAAPKRVPTSVLAAPSLLGATGAAGAGWDVMAGSVALLVKLGAFEMTEGAFTDGALETTLPSRSR